jgi:hypothetical protein
MGAMICPACGQEERLDRKVVLASPRPLALHRECSRGHVWHIPLVLEPRTELAPCNGEGPA